MPNAAAHFDDDFDVAPSRKKAPRRSAGKRKKKSKSRFDFASQIDMQRVARYGAIGMSVTVAVGIMVNALMMQKGHHPAPLFGNSIALGESVSKPSNKASVERTQIAKKPEPAATPVEHARLETPVEPVDDVASPPDDAISRLLQGGTTSAERPNAKTVIGVQRALTKLGLVVKQTGTFGPQTKKAIEHFEKDHHLPVKGEMSRRIVKLLASQSGTKIEY